MIAGLLVGCALGLVGTWLARGLAWRLRIVDRPNPIVPQHRRAIAYLGGLGIAVGAAAGYAVSVPPPFGLVVGAVGMLVLGTFDDGRPLRPAAKLVGQVGVAAAVVIADASVATGPIASALAVLWIVAVVNAVNLTDVCDGLVGWLAVVALVVVALASPAVAPISLPIAAATLGFLRFNWAPASIFLGDGGSHLLGFAIAYAWLAAWATGPRWELAAAGVLGVAVFAIELVFLVVVRRLRGIPFWRGSPDHLALRLQAIGLDKRRTVGVGAGAAVVFGALGIWIAATASPLASVLAAGALAATVGGVALLYLCEPVPRAGRMREGA